MKRLTQLLSLPTPLLTRLLIGHVTPVLIVTLALAMAMTSLLRITTVLRGISEMELSSLHEESKLHRAIWSLDVTMRRHERTCRVDPASDRARAAIQANVDELQRVLHRTVKVSGLHDVAHGWLAAADKAFRGDVCSQLNRLDFQTERAQLDDRMTELWASRLLELHTRLEEKEESAHSMGRRALWAGSMLSFVSLLLALFLARRMARAVSVPLKRLSKTARLVGRGRFDTDLKVEGPLEIVALAEELSRMQLQLAELDTLKQGFLASVSHELRTPLSKIREALALLQDGVVGELEPQQLRVVRIARNACEREIRMVTTLLDLSRLRTGNPLQLREGVLLDSIIESALTDELDDAEARQVAVVVDLEGASPQCRIDPVLLERAVANLLRNAISVSPKGAEVLVERRLMTRAGFTGPWARVRVVDQGPGVPEEIRDTVFHAFVTRSVENSPKAVGVGLGLALAREVACAHGGDLVLGETGAGAVFELWLPLGTPSLDERAPVDERASVDDAKSEEGR